MLALAAAGRVVFHESDEYIFRQGQPKGLWLWVIQQGSVELIDHTPDGDHLRDLLSEGDLLGGSLGQSEYRYSAKTTNDVILYTINAEQFAGLVSSNPQVARYLAIQSSIDEGYKENASSAEPVATQARIINKATWLDAPGPPVDFLKRHLLKVRPGTTVRDAAIKMVIAASDSLAIADEDQLPLGLITNQELRDHLANGRDVDASVDTIMLMSPRTAEPGLSSGDYFLRMMQNQSRALLITNAGDAYSPLIGVLTDSELALASGCNPAFLLEQITRANNVSDWKRLLQQLKRMLFAALSGPSHVDLCSRISTAFLKALLKSVIRQSEAELAAEGRAIPPTPYCWLLFGSAGRSELLLPAQPEIGVVFEPTAKSLAYFSAVLEKTLDYLVQCGLNAVPGAVVGDSVPACQSLSEWEQAFKSRIADPIAKLVHQTRTLFDFQLLSGDHSLERKLKQVIASGLQQGGPFIPILSNDTLSNLPPLTFFHGLVIELDGAQRETLDIANTALAPIVDAARVFALATCNLEASNTLARLEQAAISLPAHSGVLQGAARAFRIAAYHQATAGFKAEDDGSIIRPSLLSKYDQRLLKSAFDAVQQLLEVSSTVFDVAA